LQPSECLSRGTGFGTFINVCPGVLAPAVVGCVGGPVSGRGSLPFRRSVEELRREGVHILLGPGGVEPHEPHTGGELIASYPWHLALHEAGRRTDSTNAR
jgi:hypothetical protein